MLLVHNTLVLALLLGGVVGLIVGLSGAGGGVIAVPLLVFGLNLPVRDAAPVGLIAVGIAAGIGAALGLLRGIVRYRAAALIGVCGIVMAPAGMSESSSTKTAPWALSCSTTCLLWTISCRT